jgi:hypothetical protein
MNFEEKVDFSKVCAAINEYLSVEGKIFDQLKVSQLDSPLHYDVRNHAGGSD